MYIFYELTQRISIFLLVSFSELQCIATLQQYIQGKVRKIKKKVAVFLDIEKSPNDENLRNKLIKGCESVFYRRKDTTFIDSLKSFHENLETFG